MRGGRKWHRVAANQIKLFFALLLLVGAVGFAPAASDESQEFRSLAQQIERGNFMVARDAAKRAWLRQPNTEWGWRFKLQYVLCLIYTDHIDTAASELKTGQPLTFPPVLPRFRYVAAYLHCRQHDPAAPSLVTAAIETAKLHHDAAAEVDGIMLSLKCGGVSTQEAEPALVRALAIARSNKLTFQESALLSELGLAMLGRERYAEAIPYFVETSVLSRRIQAHYFEASSLANLGECYFSLGDLDRALRSLLEAHSVLRVTDPSVLRINVNNQLGSLQSLRRQNVEAVRYFREAFAIAEPDSRLSSYVPAAENLAESLVEASRFDEAEKYNKLALRALALYPSQGTSLNAHAELNRAGIAAGRRQLPQALLGYRRVLDLLKKEPSNSTKWSAYAQLAVVQERLGKMHDARRSFEQALKAIESNRSEQKVTDYQITFLSALIRFYQEYVEFLVRQNKPWEALAVADSSRASVLTQGKFSSRQEPNFQTHLQREARTSKSALLFYWLAPNASYLWAVTPSGDSFLQLKQAKSDIERDIESYSRFIQTEREDTLAAGNPVGQRLYQTLIGPVANALSPGERVVVVPDGALHSLNFETLLVKSPKPHYWLEDVNLTVGPSLGILLSKEPAQVSAGGALVIGDPIYKGTEFPPLPESAHEVSCVKDRFPGSSTVLTQRQAVRTAYASSNPGSYSLIHFSAHVDADARSPLDSAIILSASGGGNRLYARDVMSIPLHAGLVTISGCRSVGAKALSGEGMVGFAWAAFQAGAQNAVTSLWAVDDRSTTELMDHFYGGVTTGKSYASALREAKLEMLHHRYRSPYYWAPFQLYSRSLGRW